jgi:3-hydroxybutyrate dehydrogenase
MMVLITGGSKGIGRAIAQTALTAGFCVHLLARNETRLQQAVVELRQWGEVTCSMLDLADQRAVLEFCRKWRDPIHGLVNNAGYWLEDPIGELDVDLFPELLAVNLVAPYLLTKGLLARIQNGGRIVNIASQLGTQGRERMGAYAATKHGLVGLTRCWAPEVAGRAITVNAVCPGWVNTESNRVELAALGKTRGRTLEGEMAAISRALVLRRFVEPEEVAELVTFLLGTGASGISGQIYEVK